MKKHFLIVLFLLIVGFYPVFAQSNIVVELLRSTKDFLNQVFFVLLVEIFGFPLSWTQFPFFIKFVLVPFLGIFVIVYAFLRELRIFKRLRWSESVLAFLITFSTMPSHVFVSLVNTIFSTLGEISVIAFGIIFVIGIFYYGRLRKAVWATPMHVAEAENKAISLAKRELQELYEEKSNLMIDLSEARGKNEITKILAKMEALDGKITDAKNRLETIQNASK